MWFGQKALPYASATCSAARNEARRGGFHRLAEKTYRSDRQRQDGPSYQVDVGMYRAQGEILAVAHYDSHCDADHQIQRSEFEPDNAGG